MNVQIFLRQSGKAWTCFQPVHQRAAWAGLQCLWPTGLCSAATVLAGTSVPRPKTKDISLKEAKLESWHLWLNMDKHSLHWRDILNKLLDICGHHSGYSVELIHAFMLSVMARNLCLVTIQSCLDKYCLREHWETSQDGPFRHCFWFSLEEI